MPAAAAGRPQVYIIAEAGINHGGDMQLAREMVRAAAAAGVDAVKFQSFQADTLAHPGLAAEQHAFFRRYELSRENHVELAALCRELGLDFLSTPFDFAAVDLLAGLGVPAFKIASGDLTHLPLIRHAARCGQALYISTGMGTAAEARAAAVAALEAGAPEVVLLQCSSNYPTAWPDVQLRAITALADCVADLDSVRIGFSDHSIGNWCCFGAVALGACVIEKHFCLDKSASGPDIACSCDPAELAELVRGIRALEQALGDGQKRQLASEKAVAAIARRGIYYASDLPAGHTLNSADLTFLRPAGPLSPAQADQLLGQPLLHGVSAGQAAQLADIQQPAALGPESAS